MPQLAVVLATYNEVGNLAPLVKALEGLGEDLCLIVVDDNSQDGTQDVIKDLSAVFGNITTIHRPRRLGLGSALQAGLKAALATDARYVMTMDADRSHDPDDVPRLLEAIQSGNCGVVQGSRYVSGGAVRQWAAKRRLLSRAANLLYQWGTGGPRECTTNFRVFSRPAVSMILSRAKGIGYEFVPEALLLAMAGGYKVREVPITFTGRQSGKSKMGLRDVLKGFFFSFNVVMKYRLGLGRFSRRQPADRPALD